MTKLEDAYQGVTPEELQDAEDRLKNAGKYARGVGYYLRSNLREVTAPFVGDTKSGDLASNLLPSGLSGIYGLADIVGQAAQEFAGVDPESTLKLPGGEAALEHFQRVRDQSGETFGVEEAEDLGDLTLGMGPSLLVPTPDKLNKAKTIAGKVAHGAYSLVTPFRQNKLASPMGAVELAAPFAITEAVENTVDIPGYTSGISSPVSSAQASERISLDDAYRPQPQPKISLEDAYGDDVLDDMPYGDNEEDNNTGLGLLAIGAAVLGGSAAAIAANRAKFRATRRGPRDLFGEFEETNALGSASNLKRGFVDQNATMLEALRKTNPSDEVLEQMEADVRLTMNPHALNAKQDAALYSGIYPGAEQINVEPLAIMMRSIEKLSPEEMRILNNGLVARDIISRLPKGAAITSRDGANRFTRGDLAQMIQEAEKVPSISSFMARSNLWYDGMRQVLVSNGIIKQADAEKWKKAFPNFIHSQMNPVEGDSFIDQVTRALGDADTEGTGNIQAQLDWLKPRAADPRKGVLPGEQLAPVLAMERYSHNVIKAIEQNRVIRDHINEVIKGQDPAHPIYKEISSQGAKKAATAANKADPSKGVRVISVRDNGEVKHYRVYDDQLHATLLANPLYSTKFVNAWRQAIQQGWTGIFNPLWVVTKGAAYETSASMLLRRKGYGLGPIDHVLSKLTNGKLKLSNPFFADPTALLNVPIGTIRGLYGAFVKEMSARAAANVGLDTPLNRLAQAAGMDMRAVSQELHNAYMRSMHYQFNSRGGSAGAGVVHDVANANTALQGLATMAPDLVRRHFNLLASSPRNIGDAANLATARLGATRFWRTYSALLNAMHNSVKLQHYAANSSRFAGESVESYNKRMKMNALRSRQLTGDMSVSGAGKTYRVLASNVFFFNNAMQSMYQYARIIRDQPFNFIATSTTMAGAMLAMYSAALDTPEAREAYYNLTPAERARKGIPIRINTNNDFEFLPMDPMFQPLNSMVSSLFGMMHNAVKTLPNATDGDTLLGSAIETATGMDVNETEINDAWLGLGEGVKNILPDPINSPVPATALALAGQKPRNLWEGRGVSSDIVSSRLDPSGAGYADATTTAYVEGLIEAVASSFAKSTIDSINSFGRVINGDTRPLQEVDHLTKEIWGENTEQTRSFIGSDVIFGEQLRPRRLSIQSVPAQMNKRAYTGIEEVIKFGERGIRGTGATRLGAGAMSTNYALDLKQTQLQGIYSRTQQLQKEITPMKQQLNDLRKKIDDLKGDLAFIGNKTARTKEENYLRYLIMQQEAMINDRVQALEGAISFELGTRFRYSEFDASDWTE